jgi:hypothetical protein
MMPRGSVVEHKLVEQRAVVHEGLPELLGIYGARTALMVPSCGMRCAVMLHDLRVVRGD